MFTGKDIFLVTKLPPGGNYPEGVRKYMTKSLKLLQVDYLDMYLIHVPFRFPDVDGHLFPYKTNGEIDIIIEVDHLEMWKVYLIIRDSPNMIKLWFVFKELEKLVEEGKTKTIGVSNFNQKQIERLLNHCKIPPAVLQIELHAYFQQKEMVDFCRKNHIVVTAYSPLGSGAGTFGHK